MFKNEFQGGPYFEVFSAQGKDPTSLWKLQGGSGIRKVYDKDVKSYVYSLEGTAATTKMQIPKDTKQNLTLVQRFLILQLFVAKGQDISLEIGVTDVSNSKRRLNFSTAIRELSATPLHAKIPFTVLYRAVWLNCCFDLVAIVGDLWRGQTYHSVDSITVSANCRLRRVFTMKLPPFDTTDDNELYKLQPYEGEHDAIPKPCQIAPDVPHKTQIITIAKVREAEARTKGERPQPLEIDLSASGRKISSNDGYHIAFGTKVAAPPLTASHRKGSLPSFKDVCGSGSARTLNSMDYPAMATMNTASQDMHISSTRQPLAQYDRRPRLYSETSEDGQDTHSTEINSIDRLLVLGAPIQDLQNEKATVQPHPPPPREQAAEKRSRRSVRVRSGGKYRTTAAVEASPQSTRGSHVSVSAPAHLRTRGGTEGGNRDDEGAEARGAGDATVAKYEQRSSAQLNNLLGDEPLKQDLDFKKPGPRSKLAGVSPRDPDGVAQPVEMRAAPLAPIANSQARRMRGLTRPTNDSSTSGHMVNPQAADSIGDVIDILLSRPSIPLRGTVESLDHFVDSKNGEPVYQDNETNDDGLFQFSSPPKAAAVHHGKAATLDGISRRKEGRQASISRDGASVQPELSSHASAVNGVPPGRRPARVSHPPALGKIDLSSLHNGGTESHVALSPRSGASGIPVSIVRGQPIPMITPRPPESPRGSSSSRPGSGRLRSVNSSTKSSPSTSGTAAMLRDEMAGAAAKINGAGDAMADENHQQEHQQLSKPVAAIPEQQHSLLSARAKRDGLVHSQVPLPVTSTSRPQVTVSRLRNISLTSDLISTDDSADSIPQARGSSTPNSGADVADVPKSALSRVELRTRDSDRASTSVSSQASARLTRKSLKEIPKDDARLSKARLSTAKEYDSLKYQMNKDDTFDEKDMLEWMRKDQEGTGAVTVTTAVAHFNAADAIKKHRYETEVDSDAADEDSDSSSDHSLAHDGAQVSIVVAGEQRHGGTIAAPDYLNESNPREWSECSIFSPPIEPRQDEGTLDILRHSDLYSNSKKSSYKSMQQSRRADDHGVHHVGSDSEDELDLLYDPVLNCYYDPATFKYYELI